MSAPRGSIIYTPRPDATPERELHALASVYYFLLMSRHSMQKAAGPQQAGGSNDAKEITSEVRAAEASIPDT